MSDHLLSVNDAALRLGFKPKTIREWCSKGRFPNARKVPDNTPRSEWRIPESDIHSVRDKTVTEQPALLTKKRREELLEGLAQAS